MISDLCGEYPWQLVALLQELIGIDMGWKNVKKSYNIEHIVQVRDGKILIGSSYIPDLIRISFDGKVEWGNLGPSDNEDLSRYWKEITDNLPKLKELIDSPDNFEKSLPVYTEEGGVIVEKYCEEYGWPNLTHDGLLMYGNVFFKDKDDAIKKAKSSTKLYIEMLEKLLDEKEDDICSLKIDISEQMSQLEKLERDYPEVKD